MKTRFYWLSILMLLVALPAWCDIKILHGPYLQNLGEQEVIFMRKNGRRSLIPG